MKVEFHSTHVKTKEWITDFLTMKLMELHRRHKEISRAQVHFREQANGESGDKVCEIDLIIYKGSLFVHRQADSYEQAVREALAELTEKINGKINTQNQPPDEMVSTVKV